MAEERVALHSAMFEDFEVEHPLDSDPAESYPKVTNAQKSMPNLNLASFEDLQLVHKSLSPNSNTIPNQCFPKDLQTVPGIGPKTAEKLIRKQFNDWKEVNATKGVATWQVYNLKLYFSLRPLPAKIDVATQEVSSR